MKTKQVILADTVTASGAVLGARFATHAGAQATVQGSKTLGVFKTDAADGDDVTVELIGITYVDAGGVIAVGADLIADANGKAITNPEAGGEVVAGVARSVGADGGQVQILLK